MKVYIGPFKNWWGPYQIANLLKYINISENTCDKIGEYLNKTWIFTFCEWLDSKRSRNVKIRIDDYDVWNIDVTLSYIILPLLQKLKAETNSSSFVDDIDAPEELRSCNIPQKDTYDWDDNNIKRWDWLLDELIWTFTQLHPDTDWESQYHQDSNFNAENKTINEMIVSLPFDKEGYEKHSNRIKNGLLLFGKYYQALWD